VGRPERPDAYSADLERSEDPVAPYPESDGARWATTGNGDLGPELLSCRTDGRIGNVLGNEEGNRIVQSRHEAVGRRIQPDGKRPVVFENALEAISRRS
jgi:hypothetical protein